MNSHSPEVPVVVITGDDDEDQAILALQLGAQDYLIKGMWTARSWRVHCNMPSSVSRRRDRCGAILATKENRTLVEISETILDATDGARNKGAANV